MTIANNNRWFSLEKPGATTRVFCFPFSGGTGATYRDWKAKAPAHLEVVPVNLPGREKRFSEQPFHDLDCLIDELLKVLTPHLDKPYAFYGHSMGALIIFELTRQIRVRGLPLPVYLFPAGYRSPEKPNPKRDIHNLADEAFVEELRGYDGTPESFFDHEALVQMMLPMLKADFAVHETYRCYQAAPLPVPIMAFFGRQDTIAKESEMAGWAAHTSAEFDLYGLPGEHFFLNACRPLLMRKIVAALG
jgi:medium-chain acyl-[acyl-carrier-protein] hydrolase